MSKSKYKDWILATIDQLRKRKARPDLERICHMVERKHGLSFEEIVSDLQCLVREEFVIKVDYKGSTSYRNAAKWRKSHLSGQVMNSMEMARKLQAIVLSICEDGASENVKISDVSPERIDSKAPGTGASAQDIEDWLQQNDPDFDPTKINLQLILDREVSAKHMDQLPNGSYVVSEPIPDTPAKTEVLSPTTSSSGIPGNAHSSSFKSSPSKKGRPPTKRKKIKKSLGPDFEHYSVVKKKRGKGSGDLPEPETPTPEPITPPLLDYNEPRCDYCLQTSAANKKGEPEDLLICKDCQAKAHPSCMDYSEELAKRARKSPWQCIDCKTCYICEDAGDPDAMLFCDACDKGYHMSCHTPPLEDKPTGKWVCSQCVQELGIDDTDMMETEDTQPNKEIKIEPNGDGTSCLPTPSESPVNFQDVRTEIKMNGSVAVPIPLLAMTTKTEYPDASDWTIEDVVKFFEDIGFIEQACVFRDQEIDGKSLLLMKRNDVLTGLSLRLGPALKIYAHVQRLQTRGQCYY